MKKWSGCGVAAALVVLLAGCDDMTGDPHAKEPDAPYAADPSPQDPDPVPVPTRIDAAAHDCLGIREVVSDTFGPILTTHWWENQCSYEVIVFFCQDSYTGPILETPAPGNIWTDRPDCGTSGTEPADSLIFYGPEQPFYNRAQHLHAVGSEYGSTWPIRVGEEYYEDLPDDAPPGGVKWDVTYRYAVCRADTAAYWRSYLPEFTSDADGNYECWID